MVKKGCTELDHSLEMRVDLRITNPSISEPDLVETIWSQGQQGYHITNDCFPAGPMWGQI